MTSKQRSYLMKLASGLDPIFHVGKASLTTDDPKEIAQTLAQDTRSEVVQVIGKKIVLYKQADEPAKRKIKLPV